MKILGINSLAGLAMSALIEAKNRNVQYIIASIDTKRDDIFLQLFRVNNSNERLLPFSAINSIQPIKLENLNDYIVENKLIAEDFFCVGCISKLINNKVTNMKFSKELIQIPDSLWVGKLGSCIVNNNINYKNSKIAYDELKPIYVRSAEIN
jgi:tRNA A37 threonylcarbamoyladenosine modification protein TsaB